MLTGSHPYSTKGLTPSQLEHLVCADDRSKPSETPGLPNRLARELRGDLDNIVLMAMRTEPERRYKSAEQLAEDLTRYLSGEPVIARTDTPFYRAGKFFRRHKTGIAAILALLATMATGTIVATRQARMAQARADDMHHVTCPRTRRDHVGRCQRRSCASAAGRTFSHAHPGTRIDRPPDQCRGIRRARNMWAGTEAAGVMQIRTRGITTFREQDGLKTDRVWTILSRRNGELVVVTNDPSSAAWVHFFDGQRFHSLSMEPFTRHPSWGHHILLEARDGAWWAATSSGFCRYAAGETSALAGRQPEACYRRG